MFNTVKTRAFLSTQLFSKDLLSFALPMILLTGPALGGEVTLLGLGGSVNVIEDVDFNFIRYTVDILDASSISAFAVSNAGGSAPSVFTDRTGWDARQINSTQWDSGSLIEGETSGVSFNTLSIGSYESIFGSDPLVSVYYHDTLSGTPINEDSDEIEEFFFNGVSDSFFVALSANGSIIDSSRIPEPSGSVLLLLGGAAVLGKRSRACATTS